MKKLLSLLGVFIFIGCLQSYASKREIYMDFYKSGHVDNAGWQICHPANKIFNYSHIFNT